jgi:hypothetical protein
MANKALNRMTRSSVSRTLQFECRGALLVIGQFCVIKP